MTYIPTLANRAYRLEYAGTSYAGGRHLYWLRNGPRRDAPLLTTVLRCWRPQGGLVVWGWEWRGAWYGTDVALIGAVLAVKAQEGGQAA